MNKIEELEEMVEKLTQRVKELEKALGIREELYDDDEKYLDGDPDYPVKPSYNGGLKEGETQVFYHGTKIVYRCLEGHVHDTLKEAAKCSERLALNGC